MTRRLVRAARFHLMSLPLGRNVRMATVNAPLKRTYMNDLVVVEKIAQWQRLKALVLDSVSSPITRRVYKHGVG